MQPFSRLIQSQNFKQTLTMFNQQEIKTINGCISSYIETAIAQKEAVTVSQKDCIELLDFYETKIHDCNELQKKLSGLSFQEPEPKEAKMFFTVSEFRFLLSCANERLSKLLVEGTTLPKGTSLDRALDQVVKDCGLIDTANSVIKKLNNLLIK